MAREGVVPGSKYQECYAMMVLSMVPFNMSLNLLCPDEALTTYTTLVFEFLRMTALMWFQILLHFSAKVIADSTNKHLTSMGFHMCYEITFSFEVPVTAFFRTYPCSYRMVSNFVGSQFTFKCKDFIRFVTYKLFVQVMQIQVSVSCVGAAESLFTYRAEDWRVTASVVLIQFAPGW